MPYKLITGDNMGYYSDLAHNLQRKNERLKKENERLKVQIEKMKRCTNCKHNECKCEDVVCKKENECWYDKAEEEHLFLELEKVKLECWELAE